MKLDEKTIRQEGDYGLILRHHYHPRGIHSLTLLSEVQASSTIAHEVQANSIPRLPLPHARPVL